MSQITEKLILTGCRAGATCELRKLQFVNGTFEMTGDEKEIASLTRYMGRVYKAFPVGSRELAHYQKLDKEQADGTGKADVKPKPQNTMDKVAGGIQPSGTGPTTDTADNSSGADAPTGGETERHASRDGHQSSGTACINPEDTLRAVIQELDPSNDELWTVQGQPRCDAVATACGREDITRKDVDAVAPGFVRPVQ